MLKNSLVITATSLGLTIMNSSVSAVELINNGGFETGDFTGWTTSGLLLEGFCDGPDWTVFSSDSQSLLPTCLVAGDTVIDGEFAAYTGFDGFGPISYTLEQNLTLPSDIINATLSWSEAYIFDIFEDGSLPRIFSVDLFDSTGTTQLITLNQQLFSGGSLIDSGNFGEDYISFIEDVTAATQLVAGQDVIFRITAFVPEEFTGPAGFALDSVSFDVETADVETAPEPSAIIALAMVGISSLFLRKTMKQG